MRFKGGPKGPPALLHAKSTRRSVCRRNTSCSREQHQCRSAGRSCAHTTHSPAAWRCRRSSGSLDHRASPRRSHASASRRLFLAAYSRSFASARHRSWRTWLPVQSGSPQTSHGRRRIGAARWRFAWRKIAERLRPNASATARYEAPETSTSSTAAASGWVQAVQGRGIPSDYTETKRPAPAAGAEVATPPTTQPPRRDPTIGGGGLLRRVRRTQRDHVAHLGAGSAALPRRPPPLQPIRPPRTRRPPPKQVRTTLIIRSCPAKAPTPPHTAAPVGVSWCSEESTTTTAPGWRRGGAGQPRARRQPSSSSMMLRVEQSPALAHPASRCGGRAVSNSSCERRGSPH